jgi:hypothetical protein
LGDQVTHKLPSHIPRISPKDSPFNALGGGTVDDSTAFVAWRDAMIASRVGHPTFGGTQKMPVVVCEIPPGRYKITSAEALLKDAPAGTQLTWGLVIRGAGRENTFVEFTPASAATLMRNNDHYIQTTISDITFVGGNTNATFLHSTGRNANASQNWVFERVNWRGTWADVFKLDGVDSSADNNSEWTFWHCQLEALCTTFFHVGATGSQQNQDQFVNYNFYACQMHPTSGTTDIVRLDYGGSVGVYGGSWIVQGTGRAFYMPNGQHNGGAERLFCSGVRWELLNTSKMIDCAWQNGSVHFLSNDTSSQTGTAAATVRAVFYGSGNRGPNVVWDNCRLIGKHQYKYGDGAFFSDPRASYRNCDILDQVEAADFITYTDADSGGRVGGKWPIAFENCRGGAAYGDAGPDHPFNTVLGWNEKRNGQARVRVVSLKDMTGKLTFATGYPDPIECYLPLGAVVVGVRIIRPAAGAAANTNWKYEVVSDPTGAATVLLKVEPGTAWNAGCYGDTGRIGFTCDTAAKRRIRLTQTNVSEGNVNDLCLVEYVA